MSRIPEKLIKNNQSQPLAPNIAISYNMSPLYELVMISSTR